MPDTSSKKNLTFDEFPSVSREEWEAVIERDLKGKDYKKELLWTSTEGIQTLPFYRRDDLETLAHKPEPIVHCADWHIVEKIDISDLKEANKQIITALENGATGILVDIHASAFSSKSDLEVLLKGMLLNVISLHFSSKAANSDILNWLNEICDEAEYDRPKLDITFDFNPFTEALKTGKLANKEAITKELLSLNSNFKTNCADAATIGDAGANIIQQIAFALAAGNEFLNLQEEHDDISRLARNVHFKFVAASGYFLEIAKFRAFRLLWDLVLNAYEDDLAETTATQVFAKTASWNKPRRDAYNNMIRSTTEAMSAAIGGCNYISIERFDQNWANHSTFASRIARNTQLILQYESYLNKVADAGAGSYYIEKLTDDIALQSWDLFKEIEKAGGLHEAIKTGMIQEMISESRAKKVAAYQSSDEVLVGLNKYEPKEKNDDGIEKQESEPTVFFDGNSVNVRQIEPFNIESALQSNKNL